MHRREFLATSVAAIGAVSAFQSAPPMKYWTWMRGQTSPLDAWRRRLPQVKAAGIDAVLISGSPDFYRAAVPAARDEGLELHAWMFTMMRAENAARHPDWYAVSRSGLSTATTPPYVDYYKFMCPSRDEVRAYLRGLVAELASIDGLASVHLDYIRVPDVILPVALWPKYNLVQDKEYPDFDFCYCEVCRARFKATSGLDPATMADPTADVAWRQFRYDAISEVVRQLAEEVHGRRNRITAAVFPTPAIAKTLVRQDWTRWPLDAVLPMTYNGFYKEDVAWIERATREGVTALGGRIPLYSGLYVPDLPPADLRRAVERALAGGAQGVSIFETSQLTPEHWKALAAAIRR